MKLHADVNAFKVLLRRSQRKTRSSKDRRARFLLSGAQRRATLVQRLWTLLWLRRRLRRFALAEF